MQRTPRTVIKQLQAERKFRGICPSCQDHFVLADAVLFSIDDRHPEEAIAAIQAVRERIRERKAELLNFSERMNERAEKTAASVNLGKIIEKIIPSFASFMHSPGDCRALFEPIDYLIFSGLTKRGAVESITFADVKSGKARLKTSQRQIKAAVEAGAVEFAEIARSK